MKKGKIIFFGNYDNFIEFNKKKELKNKKKEESNDEDEEEINKDEFINKRKNSFENNDNKESLIIKEYRNVNDVLNTVSTSKISYKTYLYYIKIQGGFIVFFTLIILITIVKGMELYRSTIIPRLAKSYKEISKDKKMKSSEHDLFIINLKRNFITFLKISVGTIILNFVIRFTVTRISIYAMRVIHRKMIYRLVKAPINLFHDLVPVGQILNRLTQDIEIIQNIIRTVNSFIKLLFSLIACMIICYIYNKTIIFLSPIIAFYIIILTSFYLFAGRNLTRLQRISYSPIMTIFSETIRGLDIIRTSHVEENTKNKFFEKIDERYGIYLFGEGCKRWHDIRRSIFIQFIFGVIILYMAFHSDIYSVRAIAIILQYTEEFLIHLINISLFYIELENSMIGLERCEQIVKIEMEKEGSKNSEIKIDEKWSKNGNIVFINYEASYRPNTPLILKDISLIIKSGEKIGIVGKTGSGKSSLINAIARIIEPRSGNIIIDDIDIQNINLKVLREKISILPQEPFLIESNVRDNIDPLNKYTDEDILKIIDDLCLFKNLEKDKKLSYEIKENGRNLSTGEKKLICFARTLIKKNKIVIMDEATSSLDTKTKNIINKNIEKYLKDSTVLMITNQIDILKRCDKIIVIDNGEIVQMDKYDKLIEDKNSLFFKLFIN
jgi:ATP-binding cassette subfamily C (CFTR/MRP) protein 1